MKRSTFSVDFSVGFVLFVATILVVVGLFIVGNGFTLFAEHVEYKVRLPNASGLMSGSRVYLSGVHVGSAGEISLPEDLNINDVEVTLRIKRAYSQRIREDSYVWLQNEGLLGDVSLHVRLGTADSSTCEPGALLVYKERSLVDEFMGEEIRSNTADLLQTTIAMLRDINDGQGTLGQFLKNPELYSNLNSFVSTMDVTTKQLQTATTEFQDILQEVRSQQGTLGKLIFSPDYAREFSQAVKDAGVLVSNLRAMSEDVRDGKGLLGELLADSEASDNGIRVLESIARVADRVDKVLARAENSGSALDRLLTDKETGKKFAALVERLDSGAASLEEILEKIASGEGSVGMLVQDPSIAAALRDVFLGVKELGLVKSLVRGAEQAGREYYLKNTEFARLEEEEINRIRTLARYRDNGGSARPRTAAGPDGTEASETEPLNGDGEPVPGVLRSGDEKGTVEAKSGSDGLEKKGSEAPKDGTH